MTRPKDIGSVIDLELPNLLSHLEDIDSVIQKVPAEGKDIELLVETKDSLHNLVSSINEHTLSAFGLDKDIFSTVNEMTPIAVSWLFGAKQHLVINQAELINKNGAIVIYAIQLLTDCMVDDPQIINFQQHDVPLASNMEDLNKEYPGIHKLIDVEHVRHFCLLHNMVEISYMLEQEALVNQCSVMELNDKEDVVLGKTTWLENQKESSKLTESTLMISNLIFDDEDNLALFGWLNELNIVNINGYAVPYFVETSEAFKEEEIETYETGVEGYLLYLKRLHALEDIPANTVEELVDTTLKEWCLPEFSKLPEYLRELSPEELIEDKDQTLHEYIAVTLGYEPTNFTLTNINNDLKEITDEEVLDNLQSGIRQQELNMLESSELTKTIIDAILNYSVVDKISEDEPIEDMELMKDILERSNNLEDGLGDKNPIVVDACRGAMLALGQTKVNSKNNSVTASNRMEDLRAMLQEAIIALEEEAYVFDLTHWVNINIVTSTLKKYNQTKFDLYKEVFIHRSLTLYKEELGKITRQGDDMARGSNKTGGNKVRTKEERRAAAKKGAETRARNKAAEELAKPDKDKAAKKEPVKKESIETSRLVKLLNVQQTRNEALVLKVTSLEDSVEKMTKILLENNDMLVDLLSKDTDISEDAAPCVKKALLKAKRDKEELACEETDTKDSWQVVSEEDAIQEVEDKEPVRDAEKVELKEPLTLKSMYEASAKGELEEFAAEHELDIPETPAKVEENDNGINYENIVDDTKHNDALLDKFFMPMGANRDVLNKACYAFDSFDDGDVVAFPLDDTSKLYERYAQDNPSVYQATIFEEMKSTFSIAVKDNVTGELINGIVIDSKHEHLQALYVEGVPILVGFSEEQIVPITELIKEKNRHSILSFLSLLNSTKSAPTSIRIIRNAILKIIALYGEEVNEDTILFVVDRLFRSPSFDRQAYNKEISDRETFKEEAPVDETDVEIEEDTSDAISPTNKPLSDELKDVMNTIIESKQDYVFELWDIASGGYSANVVIAGKIIDVRLPIIAEAVNNGFKCDAGVADKLRTIGHDVEDSKYNNFHKEYLTQLGGEGFQEEPVELTENLAEQDLSIGGGVHAALANGVIDDTPDTGSIQYPIFTIDNSTYDTRNFEGQPDHYIISHKNATLQSITNKHNSGIAPAMEEVAYYKWLEAEEFRRQQLNTVSNNNQDVQAQFMASMFQMMSGNM